MTRESSLVRVAAVHAAAPFLRLQDGIASTVQFIREAAAGGARLVAFPETFLPGYPHWIWSHTAKRSAPFFAELFANSVDLQGPDLGPVLRAAKEGAVWVCLGVNEREGGTLYNTMVWISPAGEIVARHRKLHPTNAERTIWGRGDGRDVFVVDADFARMGGLICFEHSMELNRFALSALGEQIHVASWPAINHTFADPNARDFDHYSFTLAASHAISAQTFVIVTQGRISQEIVDRLNIDDEDDAPVVGGGMTGFIAPNGQWIMPPHRDDEAVVYADLDLSTIAFAKFFADGAGHYARPDVFQFSFDPSAQQTLDEQRRRAGTITVTAPPSIPER